MPPDPASNPDSIEGAGQVTRAPEAGEALAGAVIGPYRLLELIGEGGMGEVWLAEQKEPVRRRVALKLIKAGMDTREVVARFQSERQALAVMDHPAIAKVFDAGSTPQGRPYFAMEYVPGLPITTYADKHKLTLEQRLELFIHVCEGVQHAHQKAIIHRDLKPSNILVSEVDGKPMPRIIDFGVAKAVSSRLDAHTIYTQLGAVIGTLGYMSPEQADSAGEDIDTRTDVYSLGVILYELLVGALPHNFEKIAYNEVLRRLREDDAPKPSTKIRTLGGDSVNAAHNRGAEPQTLIRRLRGDPDAIALKALEKDRKRRYGSPSDLAADVGRYLRNEPVTAHPPSTGYRLGKYLRRHRVGVAVAAVMLLLLVGFTVAQAVALRRITRERDRADRITEFMTSMFKVSNPGQARGNSVTARELLDKASANIDTGLRNDPELQASMMYTMGDVYESLGLYPQAESLLTRSLQLRRSILGPHARDTLSSAEAVIDVYEDESRYADAEKLSRETMEAGRAAFGAEDRSTLTAERALGRALQDEGHYAEAETVLRQVLAAGERKFGDSDPLVLKTLQNLAIDLAYGGKLPEAEKYFRQLLDIDRREKGNDHPEVLNDMSSIGATLIMEGKYAEAEKIYLQTIDAEKRVLGPEHPTTLIAMGNLAMVMKNEKRLDEAEKLYRETLEIKRRTLGEEHRSTLVTAGNLVEVLTLEGKFAEADPLIEKTVEIERRTLGPNHSDTMVAMQAVAALRVKEKRYADAEKIDRELLGRSRTALGDDNPMTAIHAFNLAGVLELEGRRNEVFEPLQFALSHSLDDDDRAAAMTGKDYAPIRSDPRWAAIAAKAKQ